MWRELLRACHAFYCAQMVQTNVRMWHNSLKPDMSPPCLKDTGFLLSSRNITNMYICIFRAAGRWCAVLGPGARARRGGRRGRGNGQRQLAGAHLASARRADRGLWRLAIFRDHGKQICLCYGLHGQQGDVEVTRSEDPDDYFLVVFSLHHSFFFRFLSTFSLKLAPFLLAV